MYVSLYRRYRPQKFSDMVGQSAAVNVLRESLKEGRLGHAYLFSGPRGCGKTSAARLVAKSLNCQNPSPEHEPCDECQSCSAVALGEHLDVIEIDGASNRGIGEIRDLKSHVNLKPLSAAYKIYIIDEVHMLTEAAFNALLKTLEEPPANVVFLLATTEPHKVPVTIRSRCQHIPFHRISIADMVSRVKYVCENEKIACEPEAVWEIARQADGALRDALSLTEQAVALGRGSLTLESVRDLMGGGNRTELEKWVAGLLLAPEVSAASLHDMLARGISIERLTESLFSIFRDLWIYQLWGDRGMEALEISEDELKFLKDESPNWSVDKLKAACALCNRLLPRTRYGMRLEVFSGLLLMELINILEGKEAEIKPAAAVNQAPSQRQSQQAAPQRFAAPVPAPAPQRPAMPAVPAAKPAVAAPPFDISVLAADLGDSDFSKIVSRAGAKALPIGAALLAAELVRDDSSWDVRFTEPCPAESYLIMPQNRIYLASAIQEAWGLRDASNSDKTASAPIPDAPQPSPAARINEATDAPAAPAPAVGGAERALRLLGAEILYIKRDDEDDEMSREGAE